MKYRLVFSFITLLLTAPAAMATDGERPPAAFHSIARHYEVMRQALLNDSTKDVGTHAQQIHDKAKELLARFESSRAGVAKESSADCQKALESIVENAGKLAKAADLASTRDAFGELSKPMVRYRAMVTGDRPVVVYCSMANKAWLQPEGEIGNPYYGQKMARCGEVVSE